MLQSEIQRSDKWAKGKRTEGSNSGEPDFNTSLTTALWHGLGEVLPSVAKQGLARSFLGSPLAQILWKTACSRGLSACFPIE